MEQEPLFTIVFEDGSLFSLPKGWTEAFIEKFGTENHDEIIEKIRVITSKYREHNAWPCKFDGIGCEDENDSKYDNPDFYWEHWTDWHSGNEHGMRGKKINIPPSWAETAEALVYQILRVTLMSQALRPYGGRVVTTDELLKELNKKK